MAQASASGDQPVRRSKLDVRGMPQHQSITITVVSACLGAVVIIATGVVAGCGCSKDAKQGEAAGIKWDLSNRRTIGVIGWPELEESYDVRVTKRVEGNVEILLPNKLRFVGFAERVHVQRDADTEVVYLVSVDLAGGDLEFAISRAAALCQEFGIDYRRLEEWSEEARKSPHGVPNFSHSNNRSSPSFTVDLFRHHVREAWGVSFHICWQRVEYGGETRQNEHQPQRKESTTIVLPPTAHPPQ